ncbi:MAG: hypothetical protein V3U82_03095 [Robiginitomaculum sp.]
MPLDLTFKLVNVNNNCANLSGYAIYLWHNNAEGEYSIYEVEDQNYLRAVAVTGSDGTVTFKTIFPGCYATRYPHMHFEIYKTITDATLFNNNVLISQIAMPEAICNDAYTLAKYGQSASGFLNFHFKVMVYLQIIRPPKSAPKQPQYLAVMRQVM